MFKVENNVKYYLYNKTSCKVEKVFSNIYEIRNYIEHVFARAYLNAWSDEDITSPYGLSMSFDINYVLLRDGPFASVFDCKYISNPKTEYVIIDSNDKIFNYTEIVNELIAYRHKKHINFGVGKTYKGNPHCPPAHYYHSYYWGFSGRKSHRKGSGSITLIVNKNERVKTSNFTLNEAKDISDYIDSEMCIDVPPIMIKKAYNSMRSKRRDFVCSYWEDSYTEQYYKYGKSSSWKNSKKSKQWKNNKNTAKQTARKDYIKKCIDEEYSYDYSDDN